MQPRTLLNTAHAYDAGIMGYDRPCDPQEDGEGLILAREKDGWFVLIGPDGEISLPPLAAREVAREILGLTRAAKVA